MTNAHVVRSRLHLLPLSAHIHTRKSFTNSLIVLMKACVGQIMNATTVHVRRPGNPKKWRARILCEGIICDLALLTVDEDDFWSEDLMSLQFVSVPELQVLLSASFKCP
jgi:hypothetical protein